MLLLGFYAFLAGIITILSPCILPILPIVLSVSTSTGTTSRKRPLGIIFGFISSFTFFTLFLSAIVQATNLPANTLRNFSIIVIALLGLSLLSARFQLIIEKLFSKLATKIPNFDNGGTGLWSGFLVGISLGLLWTPCVGPILASVITLAITGQVTFSAFLITLAYALGTALPMFAVLHGGHSLFTKVPWLLANTTKIQKAFGLFTIFLALALFLNWDRKFQVFILNKFPNYGTNLTFLENSADLSSLGIAQSSKSTISSKKLPIIAKAPEITAGGDWFNLPAWTGSQPLKISQLKSKVVLVDFWTYTCINCIRTLPYLKSWHNKYEKDGLVIIGVHSPEFEFEKDSKNVAKAIKDFQIEYPVVQDNNFSTWRSYKNNYWPAKYLIDAQGNIRYTHFGEGDYQETEMAIQQLLKETNPSLSTENPDKIETKNYAKTPETYLGIGRGNYSLPTKNTPGKIMAFTAPKNLAPHQVAFQGNFIISEEFIAPQKNARLLLNFEAKDVYLVMNTASESSKIKVFVDDLQQYFGQDNVDGVVEVNSNRLYHLITIPYPGKHLLRLEFEDENVKLFAFTFG